MLLPATVCAFVVDRNRESGIYMGMTRSQALFTLDNDLKALLKAHAAKTGEPMSRVVENGIRLALAMPLAATETHDQAQERGDTRTMESVALVLKEAGFGWHFEGAIAEREGSTQHVTRKALLALARQGRAFEWAKVQCVYSDVARSCAVHVHGNPDATYGGATWSSESPATVLNRGVDVWWSTLQSGLDDFPAHKRACNVLAKLFLAAPKADADRASARLVELSENERMDFRGYGFETWLEVEARHERESATARASAEEHAEQERQRWREQIAESERLCREHDKAA